MTDKMNDEELLQAFFADCKMDEIPDDGFSDRVMQALPAPDPAASNRRLLERLWTAACVVVGIVAAVVCQGWEQIQGLLFSMKIDFLLSGSRVLARMADSIGQVQNLWMMLAGIVLLFMVWGYNELADVRE